MSDSTDNENQEKYRKKAAEFVWHHTMHSRRIYTYIFSLTGNQFDADDIYQDVGILLWEKFDQFEEGTSFIAWASKIAWFRTLEFRRKKMRSPAVLDESVLEKLDFSFERSSEKAEIERDALEHCLAKLSKKDSQLIIERYQEGGSPQQLAVKLEQTVERVYTSLKRIRKTLLECIRQTIAKEISL